MKEIAWLVGGWKEKLECTIGSRLFRCIQQNMVMGRQTNVGVEGGE